MAEGVVGNVVGSVAAMTVSGTVAAMTVSGSVAAMTVSNPSSPSVPLTLRPLALPATMAS